MLLVSYTNLISHCYSTTAGEDVTLHASANTRLHLKVMITVLCCGDTMVSQIFARYSQESVDTETMLATCVCRDIGVVVSCYRWCYIEIDASPKSKLYAYSTFESDRGCFGISV